MTELADFIQGMPKAELHLHLEGTLEPELKFELAARNGVALPYALGRRRCARAYDFDDLASFLAVYYEGMSVLLHEQDFYDLATAYFRKAALAERRLRRGLLRPAGAHARAASRSPTVVEGIRRAQVDAEAELGLASQLIMCFLRDLSAESALRDARGVAPLQGLDRRRRPRLRRARQPAREVPATCSRAPAARASA